MKNIFVSLASIVFLVALSGSAFANCADDAVNTCNKKHPTPNSSSNAYDKYELCIKAQLGQKCPNNSSSKALKSQVAKNKKGLRPGCPKGYTLKINWSGKQDKCVTNNTRPKRATLQ
ncbi:hypothetical protein [Amphritea balenae]|uniref:Secreted protein n=1 Tax=Amphritea balenae TaxID=452629 RepID=A0A3P1SMQ3_9GAMM|nr:hypothetical protein [Amphritea balenae]RRC98541.1 hypothetical protein EHS89_13065 [Amphritea balenae]GGK65360.1 hypothetical protein GCM10007941_14380 [Amphritea balenae]